MKAALNTLLILAASFQVGPAAATLLTFNSPPVDFQVGYTEGNTYTEAGYSLTTTNTPGKSGSVIRFNPFTQNALVPNNGSVHFGVTSFANPSLRANTGSAFSLDYMDIAEYSEFALFTKTVTFEGLTALGSILIKEVALDGIMDGFGGAEDFQRVNFGWTDLVQVNFRTQAFAFDNIHLHTVAEPTTAFLLLMSLFVVTVKDNRTLRRAFFSRTEKLALKAAKAAA